MGKRGRPRKIKKLEQYTVSELRDMPMGSMVRLFFGDLIGKRSVVASPPLKPQQLQKGPQKKKEENGENSITSQLVGMPLDKKADYLADALMGYLKKGK